MGIMTYVFQDDFYAVCSIREVLQDDVYAVCSIREVLQDDVYAVCSIREYQSNVTETCYAWIKGCRNIKGCLENYLGVTNWIGM